MTSLRTANLPHYVMLGLLLCVGSTSALARDVRLQGPNGNGGACASDSAPTVASAPETAAKPAAPTPVTARGSDKVKPVVGVRGGGSDEGGIHSPRWHSFLPGMFR